MVIHWIPCYDHRPATWTQEEKDKLRVTWNGQEVAVDFSDTSIIEFELEAPVTNVIHKAWREDGVLHLRCPSFGPLKEPKTIDHGDDRIITWR